MAILGVKNNVENLGPEQEFHLPVSKKALIVFTRNPELGKCKTRLAATIGDKSALDVYRFLLDHCKNNKPPFCRCVRVLLRKN